jgi:site-specific recombinase XerD
VGFEPTVPLRARLISSQVKLPGRMLSPWGECGFIAVWHGLNAAENCNNVQQEWTAIDRSDICHWMRTPKLEPRKLEWLDRPAKWELYVPGTLSDTGKPQRLYFETSEQAETEIVRIRNRRTTFGESLEQLNSARAAEAVACYRLLDGIGVTLLDAVNGFLALHRERSASVPFRTLFDAYLAKIAKRSTKHATAMRQTRDRFPALHEILACDITPKLLDELLLPLPPASRDLTMRHWKSVFRYGIKREYVRSNPVERLDFAGNQPHEVEIYDVPEIKAFLEDALENDLGLLPFYTLGWFCGIRPEGELEGLEWRYVHIKARKPHVSIPATVSKVRKFREVDLPSNAVAWLKEYQSRGGSMEGKVVPWAHEVLRNHRQASAERVGVTWIQDGMRHSFASYWLPIHHDLDRLLHQMGHADKATFSKHYHSRIPRFEAAKFWRIRAPKRKGSRRIVPFAA